MTLAQSQCPSCQQFRGDGVFCANCGLLNQHPDSGAFAATRWRRLGGAILETLLFVSSDSSTSLLGSTTTEIVFSPGFSVRR